MKKISLVILVTLIASVGLLSSFTEEKESRSDNYLVMRIYENFSVTSSKIIINYPDSTSEIISLEPFKFNDDYLIRNGRVITSTLNMLARKGYRVVSTVSDGKPTSSRNLMITTIIMESGKN